VPYLQSATPPYSQDAGGHPCTGVGSHLRRHDGQGRPGRPQGRPSYRGSSGSSSPSPIACDRTFCRRPYFWCSSGIHQCWLAPCWQWHRGEAQGVREGALWWPCSPATCFSAQLGLQAVGEGKMLTVSCSRPCRVLMP
jgi:hypothetical protein